MTEQVYPNIYRIPVPLPNNPLRELNSYFLRGETRDLLIDTGFRYPACQDALEQGLAEIGSDPMRRDVLITHLHSDHMGMADLFANPERTIYLPTPDLEYEAEYFADQKILRTRLMRYEEEGFPKEQLDEVFENNPAWTRTISSIPENMIGIGDGEILDLGNFKLKCIYTPGHTPGNSVFWLEEQKILFSGDHVLFDITPNITSWVGMEDALGDYLDSLEKVSKLPVEITFPSHRASGDFHARVDNLISHHQARLNEALRIVQGNPGSCAYDITSMMTWQIRAKNWATFPTVQKWFAVGECFSHLDYLRRRGKIRREMQDGRWVYFAL